MRSFYRVLKRKSNVLGFVKKVHAYSRAVLTWSRKGKNIIVYIVIEWPFVSLHPTSDILVTKSMWSFYCVQKRKTDVLGFGVTWSRKVKNIIVYIVIEWPYVSLNLTVDILVTKSMRSFYRVLKRKANVLGLGKTVHAYSRARKAYAHAHQSPHSAAADVGARWHQQLL